MSNNENNVSRHTFTWKINKFSSCRKDRDEHFISPLFTAKAIYKTNWFIKFYPQGTALEVAERYSACFLCRGEDQVHEPVFCTFSLEIIDEDEEEIFSKAMEGAFGHGSLIGWNYYNEIEDLEDKYICFPGDILIIRCRMQLNSSEEAMISENNAETTIGTDQIAFNWSIENWIGSYRNFRFHCPGGSEYEISLHIPQDELFVTIEKLEKVDEEISFKAVLRMSLLDENGAEYFLGMYKHVFMEGTEYWRIATLQKIDILIVYPEYIDVATLKCEFCTENWSESYLTYEYRGDQSSVEHSSAFKRKRADPLVALQEDLKRLSISAKKYDITLRAKGGKLPAHKVILSARSPVFATMFKKRPLRYVDFPSSVEANVLRIFVEYLYTGVVNNIDLKTEGKLCKLAQKYQVEYLKVKC